MLLDRLEEACGKQVLDKAFCGEAVEWLECQEIAYRSARVEPFSDVSLVISGISSVQEAFSTYTREGKMEGRERYLCEDGVLRDAVKGWYVFCDQSMVVFPAARGLGGEAIPVWLKDAGVR